jgi:hypothetical protein
MNFRRFLPEIRWQSCLSPVSRVRLVGRTPWSAADAPVGLLAPCDMLMPLFHHSRGTSNSEKA